MNWLLLIIINAGSLTPSITIERFPDYQSCKTVELKIKGYLADGIITAECIMDAKQ